MAWKAFSFFFITILFFLSHEFFALSTIGLVPLRLFSACSHQLLQSVSFSTSIDALIAFYCFQATIQLLVFSIVPLDFFCDCLNGMDLFFAEQHAMFLVLCIFILCSLSRILPLKDRMVQEKAPHTTLKFIITLFLQHLTIFFRFYSF